MITGNQAAFVDAGASDLFVAYLAGIGEGEQTLEPLDASVLANTVFRRYHSGDLIEPGAFELQIFFDPTDFDSLWRNNLNGWMPGPRQDALIRFQLMRAGQTAGYLAGTGFMTSRVWPELVNDQLAQGRATWQFDGWADNEKTAYGPVYTPETSPP